MYEILKKRTVVTMALYIVLCIIALIGLVLLYRVLDPRELKTGEDANGGIEEEEEKQLLTDNDEHWLVAKPFLYNNSGPVILRSYF